MTAEPINKACSAEWNGKARTVTVRFTDRHSAESFNQGSDLPREVDNTSVKFEFATPRAAWRYWQSVASAIQAYGTTAPSSLIA